MKKIVFCLFAAIAMMSCRKNDTCMPDKMQQSNTPSGARQRGDTWSLYPTDANTNFTTSHNVPLTIEYVEGLDNAILQGNSAVIAFLESDVAAPVIPYIPASVLAKMKSPNYFLVTQHDIQDQKVFTSNTKVVNVGNSIVDDLNGLIR